MPRNFMHEIDRGVKMRSRNKITDWGLGICFKEGYVVDNVW